VAVNTRWENGRMARAVLSSHNALRETYADSIAATAPPPVMSRFRERLRHPSGFLPDSLETSWARRLGVKIRNRLRAASRSVVGVRVAVPRYRTASIVFRVP